jgi:hypothetical protein
VLFHLCWHHQMLFDLNAPLRESTIMRAAPTGKEAMR